MHHKRIELSDPGTLQDEEISLTFEDQNNGEKWIETHKNPQETHSYVHSGMTPPWFKNPEPAWAKPRHAHIISHKRGHGEVHNPGESSEIVQVGIDSNQILCCCYFVCHNVNNFIKKKSQLDRFLETFQILTMFTIDWSNCWGSAQIEDVAIIWYIKSLPSSRRNELLNLCWYF